MWVPPPRPLASVLGRYAACGRPRGETGARRPLREREGEGAARAKGEERRVGKARLARHSHSVTVLGGVPGHSRGRAAVLGRYAPSQPGPRLRAVTLLCRWLAPTRRNKMLRIYPVILGVLRELRALIAQIERRDSDLTRQLRRCAASIALSVGEGMYSRGKIRGARRAS